MVTHATIQPPLDYHNSGRGLIISCSVLGFVANVCVVLRFWSKRLVHIPWGLDEYLILAALIVQHVFLALGITMVIVGGVGRDIRLVEEDNPMDIVYLYRTLLAASFTYGISSSLVKLSVLAFYWRMFPTRFVKMGCYIIGSICIGWLISIEIVNGLQCRPLRAYWRIELQQLPTTKCINPILFFFGMSIPNCVMDFFTLVLPIYEVTQLHISRKKKFGVAAYFLLGSIAFAASVLRTKTFGTFYKDGVTNFTKQFVVPGTVTVVEIYIAIIGACLPNMVPAYRKLRYGNPMSRNSKGSRSTIYINHTRLASDTNTVEKVRPSVIHVKHEISIDRSSDREVIETSYQPDRNNRPS